MRGPGTFIQDICFLQVLGGVLDFSTVHTVTAIETFLKTCTEEMSNRLFKYVLNNPIEKFHMNSHECFLCEVM